MCATRVKYEVRFVRLFFFFVLPFCFIGMVRHVGLSFRTHVLICDRPSYCPSFRGSNLVNREYGKVSRYFRIYEYHGTLLIVKLMRRGQFEAVIEVFS